jgi:electron transport complex protein RnfD
MAELAKTLEIRSSPHILSGHSVDTIMFNVVLALLPVTAFAVYAFGLAAVLTLSVAVISCLATEEFVCRMGGRESTLSDWSAAITGLLYGLTLPPGLPLWMVAVGGVIAVGLGKALFGGLGCNPFNPALVGRAVLQAAFPVSMTSWVPAFAADRFASLPTSTLTLPFTQPVYDGVSGATPLALWKFEGQVTDAADLALGFVSGSTGETSGLLILLGGAYLVARNMMNWRIPAAVLVTVAAISAALHGLDPQAYPSAAFMLVSGGLMLGAVFMASDMVGSPMTGTGCFVYGALIGAIVVVIRIWGGMPEGVMYAILLGNAVTPHIDRIIRPTIYGAKPAEEAP